MDLDHDHERMSAPEPPSPPAPGSAGAPVLGSATGPPISAVNSTPVLRQCTALATQARVELLSQSQHAATDRLRVVLAEICAWTPRQVTDPDPTMLALAAAALADLEQRIDITEAEDLAAQVSRARNLLHGLLSHLQVGSPA